MRLKLSFCFFLLSLNFLAAQQFQLSPNAEISVLTIGPGASLNDSFGHNAFRISDKVQGLDLVYGYGEYDFDAPNFYLKFAQGKLNYLISRHNFSQFYDFYARSNRTIKEQVLNLPTSEKQDLFNYLENNYKPENRRYLYDFFYDNCATRIRDVAQTSTSNKIKFNNPADFEVQTFRKLIHEHVGLNSWGSFGIDIALGSIIDREATPEQHMFLPKYIHDFFAAATRDSKDLVKSSSVIYQKQNIEDSSNFLLSPLFIMGILGLIILFITYKDYKNNERSVWLDILLFALTGLVGILLIFLWYGTDHTATGQNYNLLWALPLNVFMIGQLLRKQPKNWFRSYLKFLIIMLCLMTLHWIIGVQIFAIGLIPFIIALALRYFYLLRFFKQK